MRLFGLGMVVLLLLPGCASINDMLVRQMFKDWGVSRSISQQIKEGLERRREVPPPGPKELAPPFMDMG